jgi:uncharacterized protein YeeX (DUF496 family)
MGLEQRISDAICFTKKQAFQDCNKFEKSIAENRRRARLLHRLLQYLITTLISWGVYLFYYFWCEESTTY